MPQQGKIDFQEKSKKDRERYDLQKNMFTEQKHQRKPKEAEHSVLESVKDRLSINEKLR